MQGNCRALLAWELIWIDTMLLKKSFILVESVRQNFYFDTFALLAWGLSGVKDAINIMLRARAAGLLSIAFDLSLSATDTGECRPGGCFLGGNWSRTHIIAMETPKLRLSKDGAKSSLEYSRHDRVK
jgi:hypothetical protein